MAGNDRSSGPIVGQTVLYNNSGTIVPAIIYAMAAGGTVNMNYFDASGATPILAVKYDHNQGSGTWSYMSFM